MEVKESKSPSPAALLNWVWLLGFIVVMSLLFFVVVPWTYDKYGDLRYGTPRVFHTQADINPNDLTGDLTHAYSFNLDGSPRIIILPANPSEKPQELQLPYIPGRDRGQVVVRLKMAPINADEYIDLVAEVDGELIVYIADNGTFRLATMEERLLALPEN